MRVSLWPAIPFIFRAEFLDPGSGRTAKTLLPGDCGYFLHSWKIRFPHPDRGEEMEVVCPPPPDLDPAGSSLD